MSLDSVDPFYARKYHEKNYNCLHFSAEVWKALTGQDILELLAAFLQDASTAKRLAYRVFEEVETPVDPCFVVMQRPKVTPHLGVYLRGRVLHINPHSVEFQPVKVAARSFTTVRFYKCRP